MVAYRFCRPDDMPLICRAVNECYNPHFPGAPPLTVEGLRVEIQELHVWVSNAMVAREGEAPVGVMIGTKQPDEVLIQRVGVRGDYQRRGHGRHMLTSLSQKLAVLGPPRLVVEVPVDRPELEAFFEASGYSKELPYTDYVLQARPTRPIPEELVVPIELEAVREQELLKVGADVSWERKLATLEARQGSLEGWAIASPEQVEAFAFGRPSASPESYFDIHCWGCRDPGRSGLLLRLLTDFLEVKQPRALRLPRLTEEEASAHDLNALGFRPCRQYHRFGARAAPA